MKRIFSLVAIFIITVVLLVGLWVSLDSTFVVRGTGDTWVTNPHFDDPVRGFGGWDVAGCMTYVRPPKEAAAKAGPVGFDGGCNPGDTAIISQTFPISPSSMITFTYREILKGTGNHITITLGDGDGWEWVARDSGVQNGCFFCYTPEVTSTVPISTTVLTIWIEAHYQSGIGIKFTDVEVRGK